MTSHEERARGFLNCTLGLDPILPGDAEQLAAEFAAVESEAQKRAAVMEAKIRALFIDGVAGKWPDDGDDVPPDWETWYLMLMGEDAGDVLQREAAYKHFCAPSGEPTALLALLERAADEARLHQHTDAADIAKRVWEGR